MGDPTKMEWFRNLQHLPDQFSTLTWLDITFLAVIFIGLVMGHRKGVANFFGKLLLLLITVTFTHQFAEPAAKSFPFASPIAAMLMKALTFGSFAAMCYFLVGIAFNVIGKILQIKFSELFDRITGAILGCAYFILLFSFISNFALIFPGDWLHETYEKKAPVGKFLIKLSPEVHNRIIETIPPEWRGQKVEIHASS